MSAHLVLQATVDVGEQYSVQHSIRLRTIAYHVRALKVAKRVGKRHPRYWPMTRAWHGTGPPFRGSAIPDSEAKTNLYKGSVVTVSASYRPSSKVVGCGGGVWGPDKKYFDIPVQQ